MTTEEIRHRERVAPVPAPVPASHSMAPGALPADPVAVPQAVAPATVQPALAPAPAPLVAAAPPPIPVAQPVAAPIATPMDRPSLAKTGADADAMRSREGQRQEERRAESWKPWRFYLNWDRGKVTEDRCNGQFIILDSDINQCPVFYEHELYNQATKDRKYDMCVREVENCPLCERDKPGTYVQAITIMHIDHRKKDGSAKATRKLLIVKYNQQGWFKQMCQDMGGNMRGVHIMSSRESSQTSPAIGTSRIALNNGTAVKYSEDQLVQAYQHPEVRTQTGQVVKPANADLYPYNYDEVFNFAMTAEDLRRKYGGVVPAGSPVEVRNTWDNQQPGQHVAVGIAPAPVAAAAPAPQTDAAAPQTAITTQPAPVAEAPPAPAPTPAPAPAPAGVLPHPDDEIPF